MTPSLNLQSPMRLPPNPPAVNGVDSRDENPGSFDLRETLGAMEVCELSFAEFRAALEICRKRQN